MVLKKIGFVTEGGRDYNTTEISEHTLRNVYFPPFKAAVDAGVGTLMSAFNDLNGVPASANPFALTEVLRGEWKFDGFVVWIAENTPAILETWFAGTQAGNAIADVTRPVKELKSFQRVTLKSGERRRVEFTLSAEHLSFWNRENRFVVEPGEFRVMIGNNSVDLLEASFEVIGR